MLRPKQKIFRDRDYELADFVARSQTVLNFESGTILQYLAEKTGKFLPMSPAINPRIDQTARV